MRSLINEGSVIPPEDGRMDLKEMWVSKTLPLKKSHLQSDVYPSCHIQGLQTQFHGE